VVVVVVRCDAVRCGAGRSPVQAQYGTNANANAASAALGRGRKRLAGDRLGKQQFGRLNAASDARLTPWEKTLGSVKRRVSS
jgi:hypothetical protein